MKTLLLLPVLLFTALAGADLRAATPEEMIILYFNAFKSGDMEKVAANMHEGELAKFKDALLPVIEEGLSEVKGGPSREELTLKMFTGSDSMETLREESPSAFFLRFMNWVMKLNPNMARTLASATIETIGHVPEKDMAHVVYRISLDMMGSKITQLSVMSLKKQGDEWRLMMTGEIEGMGKMLQMNKNPF